MRKREKKQKGMPSMVGIAARFILCLVLIAGLTIGTFEANTYADLISNVLDADTTKVINGVDDIYTSDYKSNDELVEHEEAICEQAESEGMVLLTNNGALPLDGRKVTLLGQDTVDFVYGGSGSGSVSSDKAVTLQDAMDKAGFKVNDTMTEFYTKGAGKDYRKTYPTETGAGEFAVNEVPVSKYTETETDSFEDYNDAAIVVFGRSGGESSDLPTGELQTGYKYLELDQDEQDLLQMACDNFDKVIVLLNSNNPMELGFLNDYDVDACMWVGAAGQTGMNAIADALSGEVNPSGRLVDTYAFDSTSAPSFANLGDYTITNANEEVSRSDKYLVYGESIYVGYRYYETRYEDTVLAAENVGDYNYTEQVQFPFGYGLSYTDFTYSNYKVIDNGEFFTVSVDVTNSGDADGKYAVEIYMQSPYTEYDKQNGVEKASVELAGFTKTDVIKAGETQNVTLDISKENLKAYDAENAKTYILDAGDYYLALGSDAHQALNNILAAKGYTTANGMDKDGDAEFAYKYVVNELDSTTYAFSGEGGNAITNQMEDVDIRHYDSEYQYLTRSNWEGTFPTAYQDGNWEVPSDAVADWEFNRSDEIVNDSEAVMPKTGASNDVHVADYLETDYDDASWDTLLDQLDAGKLTKLVRMGGYATISIDAIGLPGTADKDGTAGFSSSIVPGRSGMAYPPEVVLASTWNTELIEEIGVCIGEDSLALGVNGWYAPGVNIHRSPYSGRNFEYFSEDGLLSGKMGAAIVAGARSKGCIAYMKHFALNDQETNRTGGSIFANEQAIREIFLKGFELTVREGHATAAMAGMNRIGATWVGAHKGLMTEILRNEWGFEGMVITDQASVPAMLYQDHISGLAAGCDLWLNTNAGLWSMDEYKDNATVMANARQAAKNIIYTVSRSNAMNGISSDSEVVEIMPWWQKALYVLDIVGAIVVVLCLVTAIRDLRKRKRKPVITVCSNCEDEK